MLPQLPNKSSHKQLLHSLLIQIKQQQYNNSKTPQKQLENCCLDF